MDKSAAILQFIQRNGPIVPAQVNKHIGVDVILASAMLAELASKNKVKISKLKVGGSPLYFLPGQEAQLSRFAHKLNEKDKRTHDLLEANKVLEEAQLDPLVRVSLRQIPDFAVPLLINHEGKERLFWKYFTVPDEEAEAIIKQKLGITEKNPQEEAEQSKEQSKEQPKGKETTPVLNEELRAQIKEELRRELEETRKKQEEASEQNARAGFVAVESSKEVARQTIEKQEQTKDDLSNETSSKDGQEVSTPKETPTITRTSSTQTEPAQTTQESLKGTSKGTSNTAQKKLTEDLCEELFEEPEDEFYKTIKNYFSKHNIKIIEAKVIRKNSDIDLIILLPTAMGEVKYYCKAKAKKKVNDGDLSSAYIQAQIRKMPVLFITTGEVTKKGIDLAQKEFTTMIIKQI
jgi:hypothetical protein